jgi:hypothetical protein
VAKRVFDEFYCIDSQNLEPGDLLNALKLLTDGKLPYFVSIGRDSLGKAHTWRFALDVRMAEAAVLEPGDEEVLLPTMATRFNRALGRVRYNVDTNEGVLHLADKEGDLSATTYKNEPLPPFPGRLFERPLNWGEPIWLGSGPPPGRPVRPQPNTPGYDIPLSKGSHIGGFQPWTKSALEAVKEEADRAATGELTLRADDKIEGRIWLEAGTIVGFVHDSMRGAPATDVWEQMLAEQWVERRFRTDVPRPDHVPLLKVAMTNLKLLATKK